MNNQHSADLHQQKSAAFSNHTHSNKSTTGAYPGHIPTTTDRQIVSVLGWTRGLYNRDLKMGVVGS